MAHDTREKRAEYARRYRAANKDKFRAYHQKRYREKKDEVTAYKRAYYEANQDKIRAQRQAYYEQNKDEISRRNRAWREKNVARKMLSGALQRTEKLGLPACDLTVEYIEDIIPIRCPVFDLVLELGRGKAHAASPSLDRIEPELGYVQGNVQVISNKANMMKQDATGEELKRFADWIYETMRGSPS